MSNPLKRLGLLNVEAPDLSEMIGYDTKTEYYCNSNTCCNSTKSISKFGVKKDIPDYINNPKRCPDCRGPLLVNSKRVKIAC